MIYSESLIIENLPQRLLIADTDQGDAIKKRIEDMEQLIMAYRSGQLRQGSDEMQPGLRQ